MRKAAVPLLLAGLVLAGCGSSNSSSATKKTTNTTAKSATPAAATTAPAASSTSASTCPNNPVRFAVEPYDTGANLTKAYSSLAKDLSQKLGCPVKLIISSSYAAEISAMAGGQLEMGEFGPLGYVLAHTVADAQPVAAFGDKNGKPDIYYAGLWVKKSSPITSLKQLAGKTVGLSGPTSTSGGLYPLSALINAGFKCTAATLSCQGVTIHVTGGHPESLLALTHGAVDAAEINSQEESSAISAHEFKPSNYREIWKSTAIINDPITVYGKLPAAFQAKVKQALLSLSAAQTAAVDTELGTASNGPMVAANDALYNQVRAVANAVHLNVKEL